jgi:methionine salvage enolase-phosphatase E1
MENYEQRISDIEIVKEELELNSCNEPMVKKIVEEVITGEGQNLQSEILQRWHSNTLASDSAKILLQSLQSQVSPTSSMDFELYLGSRDICTPNRKVG